MAKSRTILVAGGGIAGLTAALCLARRGFRINVYEASRRNDASGAGIQISPNALRILDRVGIGRQIRSVATAPFGIDLRSGMTGDVLNTVPLGTRATSRYGVPYLVLNRSDLHQVLLGACEQEQDIHYFPATRVDDFAVHKNGASVMTTVHPEDKKPVLETTNGRMVIIADGVHSSLRRRGLDGDEAKHSGYEAWRGMLPADFVPKFIDMNFVHVSMGKNSHAVFYPVGGGRYLNMVFVKKASTKNREVTRNADVGILKSGLKKWAPQYRELLDKEISWSVWPIFVVPEAGNWGSASAVAIGDAAHAMLPFGAQGAAMGIEDAEILAQLLENENDNEIVTQSFLAKRLRRVRRVRNYAKANGRLYHMGNFEARFRDAAIKLTPPKLLLARQNWIYDWTA